jgi:hypothetical protein
MQNQEQLANRIATVMLESNSFKRLNAQDFEAKRNAFIATMLRLFGGQYPCEVIRRLAEVEFETGLEIIKLRGNNL